MPYLLARPLLGNVGEIKLWVGLFGIPHPPTVLFSVDGAPAQSLLDEGLFPIRDAVSLQGEALNHQGVYSFTARGPGLDHVVRLEAGAGVEPYFLRVRSLPKTIPAALEGSFTIMLMSCYCAETDAVDVGRFVQRLPIKPDISVFAGDQVYLDQPPLEQMPSADDALRQNITAKYQTNWLSERTGKSGLQQALAKAPAACIPDDHEFWNNYPWPQFWKKGTQHAPTASGRLNPWADAAQDLFQDYQLGGPPGDGKPWSRLDIEPLCMLFLDTRSGREPDFQSSTGLMSAQAEQQLRDWKETLIDHQKNNVPHIGLLATGQTLFCSPAEHPKLKDAELGNYEKQFAVLIEVLSSLAEHKIQVVFLTGDVHWSRVAQATHVGTGKTMLSEVICSPSSLCVTPVMDQWRELKDDIKGIFGTHKTWFRHSSPQEPPTTFGANKQFTTIYEKKNSWSGNQVAFIEFSRYGRGVEMTVTYYPITPSASSPATTQRFKLLNS